MDGRWTSCGRAGAAEIAWKEARDGGARLKGMFSGEDVPGIKGVWCKRCLVKMGAKRLWCKRLLEYSCLVQVLGMTCFGL